MIADLFIASENVGRFARSLYATLLAQTLRHFITLDANAVAALAIPGSQLARLLGRAGFWFSRGTFDVRAVPFSRQWPAPELRQPETWFLTGSEFDVV
jgi:hypothetical protein